MGFDNNDEKIKIAEANSTINKLYDDIKDLTNTRSNLQNEIEFARKSLKDKIDKEYSEHQAKMESERKNHNKIMEEALLNLKRREVALSNAEINLSERITYQDVKEKELSQSKELWEAEKSKEQEKIQLAYNSISVSQASLKERENELDKRQDGLDAVQEDIDQQKFQLQQQILINQNLLDKIVEEKKGNKHILESIEEKENNLISKKEDIIKATAELEKVKEENSKILEFQKEIDLWQKEKKVLEEKVAKSEEEKRVLSAQNDLLVEKEKSLTEREKLVALQSRELDKKINIIKELRDSINKSV